MSLRFLRLLQLDRLRDVRDVRETKLLVSLIFSHSDRLRDVRDVRLARQLILPIYPKILKALVGNRRAIEAIHKVLPNPITYILKKIVSPYHDPKIGMYHIRDLLKSSEVDLKSLNLEMDLNKFITNFESCINEIDRLEGSHIALFLQEIIPADNFMGYILRATHAIYLHTDAPYEIQDVNIPGLILKTDDVLQFKMYMLFYLLYASPYEDQQIVESFQVTKLDNK